jgi:hypothetical protein
VDKKSKIGTIIGVVLTPIALLSAILSGGAGHGDYVWARILFPVLTIVMLAGGGDGIVVLAIFQFPLYGWFAGFCISQKQFTRLALAALLAHIIPMAVVLLVDSLNIVMICFVGDGLLAAVIFLLLHLRARQAD